MLARDHALFDRLPVHEPVFTDTSFIETLVFAARAGIAVGPTTESWLARKRYQRVFFLDPLAAYEESWVRLESQQMAAQIGEQVRAAYERHGYELIAVPAAPVAARVAFILSFGD